MTHKFYPELIQLFDIKWFVLFVFNGISTFVGYLMPSHYPRRIVVVLFKFFSHLILNGLFYLFLKTYQPL